MHSVLATRVKWSLVFFLDNWKDSIFFFLSENVAKTKTKLLFCLSSRKFKTGFSQNSDDISVRRIVLHVCLFREKVNSSVALPEPSVFVN